MRATNVEVRGESRVDLTTTCSLVGRVTRLTSKQADGGSDGSGDEKYDVRDVHTFLGVPYAKPPVGDLMFKDPEPVELWQGEKQAAEFGPACPQCLDLLQMLPIKCDPPAKVSEDCLYLNVWTPNKSPDAGLPVMVYFYGGAFISGFTDMYRGDVLVNFHDVVVVTVGYRIGVWGFLCTGDSAATGNFGLLDQVEALRWVNKHIKNFGGDPNNVTIFGQSAGGASTAYHSVSPLSQGLFKNVISQSGTLILMGDGKKPEESLELIKPYLKYLGCEATSGEEIVSFLRSQPADKLVIPLELMKNIVFLPVIDGKFITAKGADILASGNLPKFNLLTGVTKDEGAFAVFAIAQMMNTEAGKLDKEAARTLLQGSMTVRFAGRDTVKFVDALMEEYVKDSVSGEQLIQTLMELTGDVVFVGPAVQTADAQSGSSTVYFYTFEKRNDFVQYPEYVKADHGSDYPSVFGLPYYLYPDVKFSAEDRALSRKIMSYWTNFAKAGNPNGAGLEEWPVYTAAEKKHLVLDHPITQAASYRAEKLNFLKEAVAKYL